MPNKYSVFESVPRGSGWKAAGRKPSSCRGDAPLPLQGPSVTHNLGAGGEGRGGGRLRPLPARHHLPRGGREVTGKGGGLAAQLLTSRPTASPAGPRPRPRASCLPPPTRPAARRIPRGGRAPRAALRGRQPAGAVVPSPALGLGGPGLQPPSGSSPGSTFPGSARGAGPSSRQPAGRGRAERLRLHQRSMHARL